MAPDVLIIEDDSRSVHLLQLILGSQGYETFVAKKGDEGLTLMRGRRFDLIILDLMLPGMDGFDVLRQIRGDPQLADVPVIISSARVSGTTEHQATALGADAYLAKPYRTAELVEIAGSLIEGKL